jgi:hypothetical protein
MRAALFHLISAVVGGAVGAALVAWLYLPGLARDKQDYGRRLGYLAAELDIAQKIPGALGSDYTEADGRSVFYQVKEIPVLVVERNGVKTLRVPPAE